MRKKTKLRVAQWGQLISPYLPLYVAKTTGVFSDWDLDLELSLVGNDDETFAAVAEGKADFGVGDPTFCAMQGNESVEGRVVALLVNKAGAFGITRNPVIPAIRHPRDLVNLRIGTLPSPSTAYALIANLKSQNKRLLKSTQIIEAAIGDQFSLLAKNEADIVFDIEPFISIAESKGCRVIYSFADLHGPFAYTGFYTRQSVIDTKPELVQRAVSAITQSLQLLASQPEVGIEVSKKMFPGLTPEIHRSSVLRLQQASVWQAHAITEEVSWQNAIRNRQLVHDNFVDDFFSCVDNRFARQATG